MSLNLSPETETLLKERMRADGYESADDLIRAALESLEFKDELDAEDIAAIEESERQIASGQDLDWKQVSAELRREYLGE